MRANVLNYHKPSQIITGTERVILKKGAMNLWTKEKADHYFPRNRLTEETLKQLNDIIAEYDKNFDLMLKACARDQGELRKQLLTREKQLNTEEVKLRQKLCMFVPDGRKDEIND